MLDDDVKQELMSLLESPEAIHEKRMNNRKAHKSNKNKSGSTKLRVKYEDYPDGNIKSATFSGSSRSEALKAMVDSLLLYLDVDTIEDDNLSDEDIIKALEERNGDGCDYIILLKDMKTGEVLMDNPYEEESW